MFYKLIFVAIFFFFLGVPKIFLNTRQCEQGALHTYVKSKYYFLVIYFHLNIFCRNLFIWILFILVRACQLFPNLQDICWSPVSVSRTPGERRAEYVRAFNNTKYSNLCLRLFKDIFLYLFKIFFTNFIFKFGFHWTRNEKTQKIRSKIWSSLDQVTKKNCWKVIRTCYHNSRRYRSRNVLWALTFNAQ